MKTIEELDENISSKENIKNLKIKYIDISDFKNIESINAELHDWNIIWWYNGNWKSSFVEAILTSIQWQKFFWTGAVAPASLVKQGENKATIRLIISGEEVEIDIQREFRKWTAKKPAGSTKLIASVNWKEITQKSLDSLLNALTLDPLKLWHLSIAEQIKEIKATTGLDTDDIDKKIKDKMEDRKEAGQYKDKTESIYQDLIWAWVPQKVEKKSVASLIEERVIVEAKDKKLEEMKAKQTEIAELEAKLEMANTDLKYIKESWKEMMSNIKAKWLWTVAEIDEKIDNIESENEASDKYSRYLEAKKQRDLARDDWENDDKDVKKFRAERTELIANSDLPEYMEISDDLGILVDWIEYKLLNTAKKIEVAIDLVLISGSPLRMIRIEQWGELDVKTLEKIKKKIIDNNFQIFIERPVIDKYDSIIISDWDKIEDAEVEDFISKQ